MKCWAKASGPTKRTICNFARHFPLVRADARSRAHKRFSAGKTLAQGGIHFRRASFIGPGPHRATRDGMLGEGFRAYKKNDL